MNQLKTARHSEVDKKRVLGDFWPGPFVSWTYWTTTASGGMPWIWNSLGRSYWNWSIESYLGSRPDVLEGMADDGFCWKVMEGFPIWILLEFGVVSVWTKRGFHCWNIMKIIFLDLVEDISLFYRCQDVRCQWCLLLHLDSDGFVRQISIARIKHSSTFAPFFMCFSLLQPPPIHGSKMVGICDEFPQVQSLQLRNLSKTPSFILWNILKLYCFCCKCAVHPFMNSICGLVSFFSIHINS